MDTPILAWNSPPRQTAPLPLPPAMAGRPVWLWQLRVRTDAEPDAADTAVLSAVERGQAARYRRRDDRARYTATRAALRRLLGAMLGTAPWDVPLAVDRHGKPLLAMAAVPLHFNVSHSGEAALIVIAGHEGVRAVGVDIERCQALDPLPLAQATFSPDECARLADTAATRRRQRFYALWTAREALGKAAGTGIADPRWHGVVFHAGRDGRWHIDAPDGLLPMADAPDHPVDGAIVASMPIPALAGYYAAVALLTQAPRPATQDQPRPSNQRTA